MLPGACTLLMTTSRRHVLTAIQSFMNWTPAVVRVGKVTVSWRINWNEVARARRSVRMCVEETVCNREGCLTGRTRAQPWPGAYGPTGLDFSPSIGRYLSMGC